MHPFIDITVSPTYGRFTARVIWRVATGFEKGLFFILKSTNGATNFRQIGVVDGGSSFEDKDLLPTGKFEETYYKVVTRLGDQQYESDPVGTFGKITREEFCVARHILSLESRVMRQFTQIAAFQGATGKPCSHCVDPDTNQKIGISLCTHCYGTGHEGGYRTGMWTYMRILQESTRTKVDSPDGAGTSEPTNYKVHMLAFPSLSKDDLLVDPAADRRYLVDTTEVSMFKGKIPLIMTASLQLLRRTDIRYKLPLNTEPR